MDMDNQNEMPLEPEDAQESSSGSEAEGPEDGGPEEDTMGALTDRLAELATVEAQSPAVPPAPPGSESAPAAGSLAAVDALTPTNDIYPLGGDHTGRLEKLPSLVEALSSPNPASVLEAITHLRKLLSLESKPPIDVILASGALPLIVPLITSSSTKICFEALWALTNIASGTSEHTKVVADTGCLVVAVELLRSPVAEVAEQSAWLLGNCAGDCESMRDVVNSMGVMASTASLIATFSNKLSLVRTATWLLSNLVRGKNPPPSTETVLGVLPYLAQLLHHTDVEVLTDTLWALSYCSDAGDIGLDGVARCGVVPRCVELLMHSSPVIVTPALRTIGNVVTGNDEQTQLVLNCNVLPCLHALLSNPKKGIRKEAAWTLSNISAGSRAQVQLFITAGVVPALVTLMGPAEDYDCRKEAAWALSNAMTGGSAEHVRFIVDAGVLAPMVDFLSSHDPRMIMVALESIDNILKAGAVIAPGGANPHLDLLEACSGLDALENCQTHSNPEVYALAMRILQTYCSDEADLPISEVGSAPAFAQEQQESSDGTDSGPEDDGGGGGLEFAFPG